MLAAPSLAKHSVDLINEDDSRLELAGQREDGANQLVRVTVPFLRQG